MSGPHVREGSFLHILSLLLIAIITSPVNLRADTPLFRAQTDDLPLELILVVAPDPTLDLDGAVASVLVESSGEPIAGVEVLLRSSEIGNYAGFEDGDPATLPTPSITITTNSYGRATASWGLTACLLDPLSLTIVAEVREEGYVHVSTSKTITVVPHTVVNLPPHGTETIYYDVSTHRTYVSIGPSEGSSKVGDTVRLTVQVGREINYTNLDVWNVPVIKGRGAVVLSIPKVGGVPVAHVLADEVVTEAYHPLLSEDWIPISQIEDFASLVKSVEWLTRIDAFASLNVIEIALEVVPDLLYFLGDLFYGVGHGPSGPKFDPSNEFVMLDPMLWDIEKFGVDAIRMTIPIQFDVEGYHEISCFTNWQYYTGNQYVENDAGAQSQVAFYVTPDSIVLDASPVSQPDALLLTPGESSELVFDIQNTGSVSWLPGQGYALVNTNEQSIGASPVQVLANEIPPGRIAQWVVPITAPEQISLHWTEWQMAYDGEPFGAKASCLVAVVPEGEVDIDIAALLAQWLEELKQDIRDRIDQSLQDLADRFEAWLQRESERLLSELLKSLSQQCCGAAVMAPGALLLVAWTSGRRRRKRMEDRDRR
jgi:hypothetical protein